MAEDLQIRPELLLLLDEERARAAVAWPLVRRTSRRSPGLVAVPGSSVHYNPAEWMQLAGLPHMDHDPIAQVLFGAGMLGADGEVAKTVVDYAKRVVLGRLKGAR